ncbi:MAG: universal stress protein [Desulfobulbus propionicus]|nr:MAG: universal stress protein [Desulfobulbus propionicus]
MQEIRRVMSPIDFSDNAEKIVSAAAYLAGTFSADLDLVFVAQDFDDYSGFFTPPTNLPNLRENLLSAAKERMVSFLEEHKEGFITLGVTNITGQVLSGDVAEEIVTYAGEAEAQLIVMGTHGYKGIERIMFGSVAEKVVKTACCPVLTINPYRQECENLLKKCLEPDS